jgi:hypothetical protein
MDDEFLPDFPRWLICPTRTRLLLRRMFLTKGLVTSCAALRHAAGQGETSFYQLRTQCEAWRELIKTVKDEMAFHRSQHRC